MLYVKNKSLSTANRFSSDLKAYQQFLTRGLLFLWQENMHSAQVSYEHSLQQVSCKHSFCCTDSEKELAKLLNEGESIICRRAWSLLAAASVRNLLQGVLTVYLFHCTNRESAIFKCGRIDYICRSACNLLAAESARSLLVPLHKQRERNF